MALAAGLRLVLVASSTRAVLGTSIYASTLVLMLSASALYNVPDWAPRTESRLRRLDHAAIFLFIAGSYTPFCLLALPGSGLLLFVWMGAGLGVLKSIRWPDSPRAITALLYLALGWSVLPSIPRMAVVLGSGGLALLALGGVLYSAGAVIYARRRPDPWPAVFGFHELFHALVVAACACQFQAVALLVASTA